VQEGRAGRRYLLVDRWRSDDDHAVEAVYGPDGEWADLTVLIG
jgi:hypothetical protein